MATTSKREPRFHLRRFHRDSPDAEWEPDPRYDDGSHVYRGRSVVFAVFDDFCSRWPNYDFTPVNGSSVWIGTPRAQPPPDGDWAQIKFEIVEI